MIVDSEVVANAALADVLSGLGYQVTAEQAIDRFSGLRWSDCHRRIEQLSGLRFDVEALGAKVDDAIAARVGEVLAIEGIRPFLGTQAHRLLAIASSSETAWLDLMLRRLGLSACFEDRVFSAAGFPRGKPHPDIYLHAAERLGVPPSACLVVEDHPVGIAAAAAAGMTVIALLAAGHIRAGHADRARAAGAHRVAHDYAEVADIIAGLEKDQS